ncbi:unnamed protein product [Polarella glacialis]|uniref:Amino acid transporter transmembrane domain-containing protein n=1 Tax=Polarella glacialis TaxID=89957 RepID=A0A813L8N3_POLGL|nr:unnamed protein product [Polarella glacialis]CAE8718009.1 unnamed protein product [Polarella glacialis]
MVASDDYSRDGHAEASVIGTSIDELDVGHLDDETQRFVLETHLENIGFMDFIGFELASLSSQYSNYSSLPTVPSGSSGARGGMGNVSAFVTIMKSFIGMGILTLPYATAKGGWILGPLALIFVAGLSHHCMGLLVKLGGSATTKTVSFGRLAAQICGPSTKILVDVCIIVTQFGFAIAELIFIVQNVRDVVCLETQGEACPSKGVMCTGALLLLLPFAYLKSLQVLTVPVLMSNVVLLCGIAYIYFCFVGQIGAHGTASGIVAFNWAELPVFFGCAVFSFEGIGLILPIHAAMQDASHFPPLLRKAMMILAALFSSFGLCGYAAYGPEVRDMITFSIPQNKITSFLRLFYCLGIFFTYPVMMFPLFGVTEGKSRWLRDSRHWWRSAVWRSVLVGLTGIIGMQIPHFGLFLGLIGSVACSALAFVLPAVLHLKRIDRSDATRRGDVKDVAIIAFGSTAGMISFIMTLRELIVAMQSDSAE